MKGNSVKPQTAKAVLKIVSAGVAMLAYGAIHKADKAIGEKIDEHYPEPESEETEQKN
jgi:hypothetical protein